MTDAVLAAVRDEWIGRALGGELDEAAARTGVEWLHSIAGFDKPQVVVVGSPLGVQYAANVRLMQWNRGTDRHNAGDDLGPAIARSAAKLVSKPALAAARTHGLYPLVTDSVYRPVRSRVYSKLHVPVSRGVYGLHDQAYDQSRDEIHSPMYGPVDERVYDPAANAVFRAARTAMGKLGGRVVEPRMLDFDWMHEGIADAARWAAACDALARLGVVEHEPLDRYLRYLRSGVFTGVFLPGCAIVCGPPSEVRLDGRGRLHSTDGPAIRWPDGHEQHHLHGQYFTADRRRRLVDGELEVDDVLDMWGDRTRKAALTALPAQTVLDALGAELVDTCLYRVRRVFDSGAAYCVVTDHGLEWVPRRIGRQRDAGLALAHTQHR